MATAYHRTVTFECRVTTDEDGSALAAQQNRIMQRYQPEGGYRTIDAGDEMYAGMLGMLVALRLEVVVCRAKFKLAQNRSDQQRQAVIDHLRARRRPYDHAAADALTWALGQSARPAGQ